MHAEITNVTPLLASSWLERLNVNNRKVSYRVVDKYSRDMSKGDWVLNHQGVAFDKYGHLADGQHRLLAIIKSGVTVPMMVTYGSARTGIDELKPKNTASVIMFGNMSDWITNDKVKIAKSMMRLYRNIDTSTPATTSEVVEFCEKNKDAINFASDLFRTKRRGIAMAMMIATIATAYYYYEPDELRELVASLYSGVVTSENKRAAAKIRDILLDRTQTTGGTASALAAKKITKAIDAYCNGIPIYKLHQPADFTFTLPPEKR